MADIEKIEAQIMTVPLIYSPTLVATLVYVIEKDGTINMQGIFHNGSEG